MAVASTFADSTASSSLAVTVPLKKYDVFISFRGEDTRANFTSFLHDALCRNYVEAYIDYRIDKGDEVWKELERAIKESNLFLVVFSENYASSTWCLNELVEIMECKKNGQDDVVVIPVFYHVDPSHVRKQTGSYHTALTKHKKQGKDKMQKWKDALREAANLSGFHSSKYGTEFELIKDIIKAVLQNLNYKYTNELRCLFIPDENYSRIQSLLKVDSEEVRIIGIWGMGGIGKTTLAAAVFHTVSSQYQGSCFLENVTEESERHGLNYICNRLFSKLLREDLGIDTPKVVPANVMRRLRRMKAFAVLDGVNTFKLLENLIGVGRDWLGAGSKVIVTTRDKQVLISGGVDEIHEVKEMNFQNSFRLFSLNAFHKTCPEDGYEELSKRAIVYAKGNPLALKVLGSFLRSKSEIEWDSALNKLKEMPNAEIQEVLRLSYDKLDDIDKNIFLDIACFFKGCGRNKVTQILNACGFFADNGIRNLLDKALITTDLNNHIQMHDLMQEMGREIVREEPSKNLGRRSRLWDPKEVREVLTNNRGTGAVEGIQLDMTQITPINLSPKAFKKMPNLRLLAFQGLKRDFNSVYLPKRINSVFLPKGLKLLPKNLRYFEWDGYPSKSLPPTFCPEKLVELSLPYNSVEKLWEGVQNLPNLEKIDLRCSTSLKECPNLSRAPNLKFVGLSHCESLSHVDRSILSLQKLEVLSVSGCTSLKSLCSSTCSPFLKGLYAARCSSLQEFSVTLMPRDCDPSTTPFCLNLGGSGLNELPPSILHMRNLGKFYFPISDSLMHLPENFANEITLSDSRKQERDTLITLHEVLPSPGFQSVRRLFFDFCHSLHELPENISSLSSLEYLRLYDCSIISLPESVKYLPRLQHLEVDECKMLQSIPALPQSIQCFHAWNCEYLEIVLSSKSEPSMKQECTFLFPNCVKLDQDSYHAILEDAILGIQLGAKPLSAVVLEDHDDDDDDDDETYAFETVRSGKICYILPARTDKLREWFDYHSTQALFTVELPPNLLGFIFYLVLSQVQSCHIGNGGSFGCECCLETSWDEKINITSFFVAGSIWFNSYASLEMMSDHVFLWYDAQCCKLVMEEIEESRKAINHRKTRYKPKITFEFFAQNIDSEEALIKECGLRWIYPLEDQIVVGEGGSRKSKRSREIQELESSAVQNTVEGSEFDEQEETIPPTKKLKQHVFGTLSNPEADQEIENLRRSLEELLHIGFCGNLM